MFIDYIYINNNKKFASGLEIPGHYRTPCILDLLHIIKLVRMRIIKEPITISTSLKIIFPKESLDKMLNLGNILNDLRFLSNETFQYFKVLKLY